MQNNDSHSLNAQNSPSANNHPITPLTAKEKKFLEFIEDYVSSNGISPSYQEIKDHFGFASYNSIQRYLKQLQIKKYIFVPGGNQKRAISVLRSARAIQQSHNTTIHAFSPAKSPSATESFNIPMLGRVAAGLPLEAFEYDEYVEAPASMLKNPSKSFALKVVGESMIEDGILDGDIILIHEQPQANDGEIIVASVENEATVKRIYRHENREEIELRPSNSSMETMWFHPSLVNIKGIVVGLIRQY